MQHYIGLDVSMETTAICAIDETGKIVFETAVYSDPDAIFQALQGKGLSIKSVALESGGLSHWLLNGLCNKGLPAICIDARKMSKIISIKINKTDKNDARLIAEALRCNFYSLVHNKTDQNVQIRMLIAARRTLKNMQTSLKNTIRGHLKMYGIRLGPVGNRKFVGRVQEVISDKGNIVQIALNGLLLPVVAIQEQLDRMEKHIEDLAKTDSDIELLTSIPGVGNLTAITFKAILGEPERFANSRAVGAFLGMTPTQYSSGETQKQGKISKRGSSEGRMLLSEAAASMLYNVKSWNRLKAWGIKLKSKKGHKKAVVALGRKLGTVMHRMLITKEKFKFGEQKTKAVTA